VKEEEMERVGKTRASLLVAIAIAAGLTVTLLLVTRSGNASGGTPLVKTARNAALGKTILVTRGGLTLYSLSAERHGRFICTGSMCLSVWKPLVVARGVTPTGVKGLTVVKRPDAKRQVAFRGAPLYRFVQDTKPGQVNGNGFKDVGVWRPVTTGTSTAQTPAPAPAAPSSYGY
jgi:predicted lipoprotein with Yx(FWY)xxD motif